MKFYVSRSMDVLKETNDNILKNKNICESGLVFFYQRWKELLFNKTLDTYQYSIHNAYTILEELNDILSSSLNYLYKSRAAINDCKAEALHLLKLDDVLEKHKEPLINRLREHLGKSLSKSDEYYHQLKMLKHEISYAKAEIIKDYDSLLLNTLKEDIIKNNLENIEKHTKFLISLCLFYGWSSNGLFVLPDICLAGEEIFDVKWTKFCSIIKKTDYDHVIYMSVNDIKIELETMGFKLKEHDQIIREHSTIPNFRLPNSRYFKICIKAPDIYSAAQLAINEISKHLNMAIFHNIIKPGKLFTLYIINLRSNYFRKIKIHELNHTYDQVYSSNYIFHVTNEIFQNPEKQYIKSRLNSVFAYASISRSSIFQEQKYINLWVALESLLNLGGNSQIDNMKNYLPPILCTRYIYKIIRNFIEDCIRCEVSFRFSTRTIDMEQSSNAQVIEIIKVFNDSVLYEEFKQKCKINTLLSYRLESIHKLITDISNIKKKLLSHTETIKWHVQRLFRIRNEIMHLASIKTSSILIYVEHLFDYLGTVISETVLYCKNKNLSSLNEIYIAIKDNYDSFMKLNYVDGVLKTGIIDILID